MNVLWWTAEYCCGEPAAGTGVWNELVNKGSRAAAGEYDCAGAIAGRPGCWYMLGFGSMRGFMMVSPR